MVGICTKIVQGRSELKVLHIVYIYTCVYAHILRSYIHTHICDMHACMRCVHGGIHEHTHMYMDTYAYTYTDMHIYMYVLKHTDTYTCACTDAYKNVYVYIIHIYI